MEEEPRAKFCADLRIQLPNHALIIGATQSGKTRLALYLLTNPHLFTPPPKRILFYYDQFQQAYIDAKAALKKLDVDLLLFKGFSNISLDDIDAVDGETILLIDDFSEETSSSVEIARIATNGRHKRLSLWLIWHQLFSKHAASRTIAQNARYYFFLPSLRLESQLRTLGAQLGMRDLLVTAFRKSVDTESEDYRYLLLDLGPNTNSFVRLRSRVHCSDYQFCYF